jgi:hypothetical protein
MGEKGAEVAPGTLQGAGTPINGSGTPINGSGTPINGQGAEVAGIASILSNIVDAAAAAGSTSGTTATAQPIGELGSELSGALPEGLTPSVPTLTAAPAPVPTSPHLDGLQPSLDVASDAAGPGDALRP